VSAPVETPRNALLRRGLLLEYLTLSWNVVGVVVLGIATIASGSIALAGFGVDSLIEIVASSVVVWELRGEEGSRRERLALRIIAVAFALLAIYIAVQVVVTLAGASRPRGSTLGVIWLAGTVVAMWLLAFGKHRTGVQLRNRVLMTEARVTVIDGALAGAVLIGVALNAALGWWWADPVSSLVILVYGVREARHAWQESCE
jgi:divalent metal cation (Fe/Co/Zn/Cd) transporter